MVKKNNFKKILSMSLAIVLAGSSIIGSGNFSKIRAEERKVAHYIVQTTSEKALERVESRYDEVETTAENETDNLNEDNIITLSLTENEAAELKESNMAVFIEKDAIMNGATVGENEKIYEEWDAKENVEWNIKMINADIEKEKNPENKVKIAIIDSGIDYCSDIDVKERANFIPGEENVSPLYEDGSGHGTSVAGIIAAKDNDEGITGINENVEMYSAKVLDSNNQAPISRVIEAIDWAIDKEVNIINMSLGTSCYSRALHNAIKKASDRGILVVTAAGNGENVEYPAAFEETIAVGSVGADGVISERSGIGQSIEVVAPGEQILSTAAFDGVMASSGTSMAAPHVTGIASVLWQKNKDVPAEFIRELICGCSRDMGDEIQYGNGIVDLQYALDCFDDAWSTYQDMKLVKKGSTSDNMDNIVEKNEEEVKCFDDVEIVEGRWSKSDHQLLGNKAYSISGGLTSDELGIIKKGLVVQDDKFPISKDEKYKSFHGYLNYVNDYECLFSMAKKCKSAGLSEAKKIENINNNSSDVEECNNIKSSITAAIVKEALDGKTYNYKNSALILLGMSMHVVSDTYAHRVYVPGVPYWTHITHDTEIKADDRNTAIGEKRYKAAGYALGEVLAVWNGNCPPSFEEYDLVDIYNHSSMFRLTNYNKYSARCENGISYEYYKDNIKQLSCKYVSEGKGEPE